MYCEKPVIATNTGGPLETVADAQTGYLVVPDSQGFSEAMAKLITEPKNQATMGAQARQRVISNFSFLAFQRKLIDVLNRMSQMPSPQSILIYLFIFLVLSILSFIYILSVIRV